MKSEHGLSMYYRAIYILDLWFEEVCEFCRGCKFSKQSLNFLEVKKYTIGRLKFCMNLQLFAGNTLFICFRLLWGKNGYYLVPFFIGDNPLH